MAGKNYYIASWNIENFSCWNQDLHGNCIVSPEISFERLDLNIKLYPRGTSGQDDHMVVHLSYDKQEEESSGDLSFICGDGSTLFKQRVHFKVDEYDLELPHGPKYEEVIRKIREIESDLKDQLTLRLEIESDGYDENHVCTVIQIFDFTMEVDTRVILKDDVNISYIRYIYDNEEISFCLKTSENRDEEEIELCLQPSTKNTSLVNTHLSLISNVGSLLRYENNKHRFQGEESWTFSKSLTKRELTENVKTIVLNLKVTSGWVTHTLRNLFLCVSDAKILSNSYVSVCMKKALTETQILNAITHKDQENSSECVLLKELKCLYQDQDFSDLQLKCQSVSFPVHRSILSARSAVFKTMLSTDMIESASGCVDIGDLDPSTLSRLLAFLYTGEVEDLDRDSALKLYYAADKYLVPSLKRDCAHFLSDNVSISNVCDVLLFGDKHQDAELTAAAQDFILKNYNEVLKSKEWGSFMCSEPLLAVKTVTHFAAKDFVGNLNFLSRYSFRLWVRLLMRFANGR